MYISITIFIHVILYLPLQPNLNELPIESASADSNKENISRKRSLSDSTAATGSTSENVPPEKKVKIVDIVLDNNSNAAPDVKQEQESFVDGVCVCMCCVNISYYNTVDNYC